MGYKILEFTHGGIQKNNTVDIQHITINTCWIVDWMVFDSNTIPVCCWPQSYHVSDQPERCQFITEQDKSEKN